MTEPLRLTEAQDEWGCIVKVLVLPTNAIIGFKFLFCGSSTIVGIKFN